MSYVGNKPAQTTIPADDAVTTAMLKDDAVTSAKIDDATIVNADVSASAEIAVTKLSTTGTPTSSTVLKGDYSWGTVEGSVITTQNNFFKNWNAVTGDQTTTIASDENAGIIGTITVNSGITWTIVGTLTFL